MIESIKVANEGKVVAGILFLNYGHWSRLTIKNLISLKYLISLLI
jgi:hypothetical protein